MFEGYDRRVRIEARRVTANRYAIIVFWSEDDRAWVADVPDLKSCAAFGGTPEEAFAEVRTAMDAWLAAARDAGLEIPKPQFRPHHEAAEWYFCPGSLQPRSFQLEKICRPVIIK
jgi:predicted RNase H-like HicB family nuclease